MRYSGTGCIRLHLVYWVALQHRLADVVGCYKQLSGGTQGGSLVLHGCTAYPCSQAANAVQHMTYCAVCAELQEVYNIDFERFIQYVPFRM